MNDSELLTQIRGFVRDAGLAADGDEVAVVPLGGGVSNDVFAVTVGERRYVLKQALAKLRVTADWRSDITRIHREAACQRWLQTVLAPGEVPAVVWEDLERHVYVMDHAPLDCLNWKDELLAGRVPAHAAARAGGMLGRIHAAGAADAAARAEFADQTVFDQLRLDPYLREIAHRHPALARPIGDVLDRLASSSETVVHGDYSPKNMLLLPERNILLDHEVVHTGDPRFDLGFLGCHLTLKALHVAASSARLWPQLAAMWDAYRAAYAAVDEASWMPHLGCLLLARVDGKSPAGYLTAAEDEQVRALATPLIRGAVTTLDEMVERARRG